ncbi:hypothetical protein FPOAC1_003768 [Fusarium poae]|uniref:hypothetical protein n=1 Tax=Fusarium poae TaxID=36050 RepID=UPI001CE86856|nr:hypothetical protein FPOAC1_003768 [Fusarium poae]KAG8677740.1 hypothetical protein FPOAC1_003768 [Fusarium poae]
MPCTSIAGKISFPDLPGLVARVAATVEWQRNTFSEESLRGTHIMLCKDIDKNTRATVAMRVGGDIMSGSVYRKEGYVLEIYDWVKGNVRRFRGRQWLVGSVVEDAEAKAGVCA